MTCKTFFFFTSSTLCLSQKLIQINEMYSRNLAKLSLWSLVVSPPLSPDKLEAAVELVQLGLDRFAKELEQGLVVMELVLEKISEHFRIFWQPRCSCWRQLEAVMMIKVEECRLCCLPPPLPARDWVSPRLHLLFDLWQPLQSSSAISNSFPKKYFLCHQKFLKFSYNPEFS